MSSITLQDAWKWLADAFTQDWAVLVISLFFGLLAPAVIFFILWVFDKHNTMNPKKRKFFYFGVALAATSVFVIVIISCDIAVTIVRRLNAQIEDIRNSSVQRLNAGITASVLNLTPTILNFTNIGSFTNLPAKFESMTGAIPRGSLNSKFSDGSDFTLILRISNAGMPASLWDWNASVVLPDGTQIPAMIPAFATDGPENENITVVGTMIGIFMCNRQNSLLQSPSLDPLSTGAAMNGWMMIHLNGIKNVPDGTCFKISFTDTYGRTNKIEHYWKQGQ